MRAQRHAKLQTAVEELLGHIIKTVNEKKEHIPPVLSPHTLTFPFDITVAGYACVLPLGSSLSSTAHTHHQACRQGGGPVLWTGRRQANAHAHKPAARAQLNKLLLETPDGYIGWVWAKL